MIAKILHRIERSLNLVKKAQVSDGVYAVLLKVKLDLERIHKILSADGRTRTEARRALESVINNLVTVIKSLRTNDLRAEDFSDAVSKLKDLIIDFIGEYDSTGQEEQAVVLPVNWPELVEQFTAACAPKRSGKYPAALDASVLIIGRSEFALESFVTMGFNLGSYLENPVLHEQKLLLIHQNQIAASKQSVADIVTARLAKVSERQNRKWVQVGSTRPVPSLKGFVAWVMPESNYLALHHCVSLRNNGLVQWSPTI